MNPSLPIQNPFPGLRPFKTEEATLFFGRDDQIGEALDRMLRQKLLAVVGVSGCGKSSLVSAGMIPALEMGLAGNPEQHWQVASMRPGDGPLRELTRCLGFGEALAERTYGLLEAVESHLPAGHNLLLLVDQFEEIFPFRDRKLRAGAGSEADLFVSYLLRASQDQSGRVYVLLTMRSDYLGECAKFHELPEALNDGQYLVPRMTRRQLQEAIEGPLEAAAVTMHPALVQDLLNQCDEEPDNLPLLQHLLRRMFEEWMATGGQGPITATMSTAAGGLAGALNQDAETVCAALSTEELRIAESLFRRITESRQQADRAEEDRPVRKPQTIADLAKLAQVDEMAVRGVVALFEQRGLLVLRRTDQGDKVDLPHECLCLRWTRLKDWIRAEAEDAKKLRFLWDVTERKALLAGLALDQAMDWKRDGHLAAAWCSRYLSPEQIAAITAWVSESHRVRAEAAERERERQKEKTRNRWGLGALILFFLLMAGYFYNNRQREIAKDEEKSRKDLVERQEREKDDKAEAEYTGKLKKTLADVTTNRKLAEQKAAEALINEQKWRRSVMDSLSSKLASESELIFREDQAGLERALLFAIESVRRQLSLNGERALRQALNLLPENREDRQMNGKAPSAEVSGDGNHDITFNPAHTKVEIRKNGNVCGLQHQGRVRMVALSKNRNWLATGSDDGTARVMDTDNCLEVARLPREAAVTAVSFTSDGKAIETWTKDGTARLMDLPIAKEKDWVVLNNKAEANALAFSQDARLLAIGSVDNAAYVINVMTMERFKPFLHQGPVNAIAFSPDGKFLITKTDRELRTTNISTGISSNQQDARDANAISISPDGRFQAAGGNESKVFVTNLSSEHLQYAFDVGAPVFALTFSPDRKWLATGDTNSATQWDLSNKRESWKVKHPTRVYALAYSQDGKWLASGGGSSAKITEVTTGTERYHFDVEDALFAGVQFTPDGKWLQTVHQISEENKGLIYSRHLLDTDALKQEACKKLTRNLCRGEWKKVAGDLDYPVTCPGRPIPPENSRLCNAFAAAVTTGIR